MVFVDLIKQDNAFNVRNKQFDTIYDKIKEESISTNLEINATSCVYFSKSPVIRN
jgi:hypothetical protein